METSITSETISQQPICGESENIEIANDTDPYLNQSKDQMEVEQTRKNLMQTWQVYFKYFSCQKMAHTKATVRRREEVGAKTIPDSQMVTVPSSQPSHNRNKKSTPIWKDCEEGQEG